MYVVLPISVVAQYFHLHSNTCSIPRDICIVAWHLVNQCSTHDQVLPKTLLSYLTVVSENLNCCSKDSIDH